MGASEKIKQLLERGILVSPEEMQDEAKLDALLSPPKKQVEKEPAQEDPYPLEVLFSYEEVMRKRTFQDFVSLFNHRFKYLSNVLRKRVELQGVTSLQRIQQKKEKENVSLIGMVYEKRLTKNDNFIFTLEDPTGKIKVLVHKNRQDLYEQAKEIMLDEVIGISGTYDEIVFANSLFVPDIPITHELKKGPEDVWAAFLSDPQIGNKHFLKKEFHKFLYWINGKLGNEQQKAIAKKTKYLIIPGDLVEGVGVFPGQEEKLAIPDISEQYNQMAKYLKEIPTGIKIVLMPGNHDAGRLAEPQPTLYKDYAKALWDLPNVTMVSNPSLINIGKTLDFEGFNVLLYHGASIIYYASNIESVRIKGGMKRPELVMRYLLQRRHLAPTHSSTLYIPDPYQDPLLITTPPDFFVTGHIHRAVAQNYRNITMINASAWDIDEEYYNRRGLEPQPARVFLVNLQTREIKVMNFLGRKDI